MSLHLTPLNQCHRDAGATMGPFGGWDMPILYQGIIPEHEHTRTVASIFDTCHMGEFDIKGPSAEADLEKLLTMNVATIAEGQCRYGFLLNNEGGVIDDLTCYRRGPDHFFLVVNAGTLGTDEEWISRHLSPNTVFTDLSPKRAKIDIQGPQSKTIMEKILGHALPELGYFKFVDTEILGVPMTLSRTGYTGEWGYEMYFAADEAERMWNTFTESGEIKPAGLGARDTLRLEMGYALYGHELDAGHTPYRTTRGMFMYMEKEFIGKAAVEAEAAAPKQYLVALQLETKRAAREDSEVVADGKTVGTVCSGSLGPSVGCAVAMAYVDVAHTEPGTPLAVVVRGKELPAVVTSLPFYKEGTARAKNI